MSNTQELEIVEAVEEVAPAAKPARKKKTSESAQKKITAKDVDTSQMITVINGFQGKLVYTSKKTGEKYVWSDPGDVQEIELRELRAAKSSYKKYFTENWFMFDEDDKWVINYLGVSQYYENAINVDDFDSVFEKSADEVVEIVSKLSGGQKRCIGYRARVLISEGKIDSLNVIKALEGVLNTELIEH